MKKTLIITAFALIGLSINVKAQTAYISNESNNTVSVINVATNTVTATIPLGSTPAGVSVSKDGRKVYVANQSSNTVSVINTATNIVMASILVGTDPVGVSVSPDGSKVFVSDKNWGYGNTVSVINTATNTVSATITVGNAPEGVTYSPDGSKVYVANETSNTVSVINAIADSVIATITVGNGPRGITISPNGKSVYVANGGANNYNTVSVINTAINAVSATITVGTSPYGISVSPDSKKVYVANYMDNTVSVINAEKNKVTNTIPVGSYPIGVSVSSIGDEVYVANSNASNGTVSVINTSTNTVSNTISIGDGASPVAEGNFISNYSGVKCTTPVDVSITNLKDSYNTKDTAFVIEGSPTGGIFYGAGISNGLFYPNALTDGKYNIVYIYTDSNGCSGGVCQNVTIKSSKQSSGIKVIETNNNDILIYPNPAGDNITIENNYFTRGQIIFVYDIQGELLMQQSMLQAKTNIDISAFAKGVYFIKVNTNNGFAIDKFVKE